MIGGDQLRSQASRHGSSRHNTTIPLRSVRQQPPGRRDTGRFRQRLEHTKGCISDPAGQADAMYPQRFRIRSWKTFQQSFATSFTHDVVQTTEGSVESENGTVSQEPIISRDRCTQAVRVRRRCEPKERLFCSDQRPDAISPTANTLMRRMSSYTKSKRSSDSMQLIMLYQCTEVLYSLGVPTGRR